MKKRGYGIWLRAQPIIMIEDQKLFLLIKNNKEQNLEGRMQEAKTIYDEI